MIKYVCSLEDELLVRCNIGQESPDRCKVRYHTVPDKAGDGA